MHQNSLAVADLRPAEIVRFGADDIDNPLAVDPSRIDRLPFGAILLDPQGRIVRYSKVEAEFAGRNPADVLGKNFFDEIAPCSKGQILFHKFFKGVAEGSINLLLDYRFDYGVAQAEVRVHLKSQETSKGIWMFIKRV